MAQSVAEQLSLPLLPAYEVRISGRVKRMQLQVLPQGQVEVVVPKRHNPSTVVEFVVENQAWLNKALQKIQQQPQFRERSLPRKINLRAVGKQWEVCYRRESQKKYFAQSGSEENSLLEVVAPGELEGRVILQRWLASQAKELLVPWLRNLSVELELPFGKVSVRGQKTRWGSCSALHTISINRSLLFLPAKLVRYLFVHELCHTVHANHSKTYWKLVRKMEPDYQKVDDELREAGRYVPNWAIVS